MQIIYPSTDSDKSQVGSRFMRKPNCPNSSRANASEPYMDTSDDLAVEMGLKKHFQSLRVLPASTFPEDKFQRCDWNHCSSASDQKPFHQQDAFQTLWGGHKDPASETPISVVMSAAVTESSHRPLTMSPIPHIMTSKEGPARVRFTREGGPNWSARRHRIPPRVRNHRA